MHSKKIVIPLFAASLVLLISGTLQVALTNGQTYPEVAPHTTPSVSQEEAVQLALQEAQTLDLTPFFGGIPVEHQVDPNPTNVSFYYSFTIYPKWLITFNATFYWVTGHCPGSIQVQVAADTGQIDNANVKTSPNNETTPTAPSQTPKPTPSPTPTLSPSTTPTPTPSPTLTPVASPSVPELPTTMAIPILVAATLLGVGIFAAARARKLFKQIE